MAIDRGYNIGNTRNKLVSQMFHTIKHNYKRINSIHDMSYFNKLKLGKLPWCRVTGDHTISNLMNKKVCIVSVCDRHQRETHQVNGNVIIHIALLSWLQKNCPRRITPETPAQTSMTFSHGAKSSKGAAQVVLSFTKHCHFHIENCIKKGNKLT